MKGPCVVLKCWSYPGPDFTQGHQGHGLQAAGSKGVAQARGRWAKACWSSVMIAQDYVKKPAREKLGSSSASPHSYTAFDTHHFCCWQSLRLDCTYWTFHTQCKSETLNLIKSQTQHYRAVCPDTAPISGWAETDGKLWETSSPSGLPLLWLTINSGCIPRLMDCLPWTTHCLLSESIRGDLMGD